jgi:hypothetical protein
MNRYNSFERRKNFRERSFPFFIIIITVIIFLFIGLTKGFTQQTADDLQVAMIANNEKEVLLKPDSTAKFFSFKAVNVSGTVFLNWLVKNQKEDGLYLIYRSFDGISFQCVGSKNGTGVPIQKEISYSFADNVNKHSISYYKILHVSNSYTYLMSEKISIDYIDSNNN